MATAPASHAQPQQYLMCPPDHYDVNYVINPWMEGNICASSRHRAEHQWQQLHTEMGRIAEVRLVPPAQGWPDMVFTANAGLARNGVVAISSFLHPERQGEEPHFRAWFRDAQYRVEDTPRDTPFEGEGDALFSADGHTLFVGCGPRTQASSHAALRALWDVDVVSLRLVDPRFYHLDTCFAPLENGQLLYFPAAFDADSNRRIEQHFTAGQRIAIAESDATRFACNAVNVGHTVLVNRISAALDHELRANGFAVVQLELDEFMKAGGAAKCLVMKLSPPAAA